MRIQPLRSVPAPSSALLKFLRAQHDGCPFFISNTPLQRSDGSHRRTTRAHGLAAPGGHPRKRSMCTYRPEAVPLEASFFNLDTLWPRIKRKSSFSAPLSSYIPPSSTARKTPSLHTTKHESLIRRLGIRNLWGMSKRREEAPLQPNDLPQLSNFPDDNASIAKIRPSNELRIRCTEFDENGNVTLVNGEFKKSELIAMYGLLPRDLRKIDSSLLPHILVRPSAILINLLHLRVLIKHNRVLVFDAYGSTDSYTQSVFMYDLGGKLRARDNGRQAGGGLPYEFRALEAVLVSATNALENEFEMLREPVVRVLRELEEDIDRDKLRYLLIYSKKLGSFEQKARLVRDAIDDLLEADDDLAAMYLTEKAQGRERDVDDHTEVEMLLESYHKVCDEIVQVSGNLVSNIRNTEEIVKAILDANRNSLMLLDLKFSIGTLGIGAGTFIAALYGMNLKNSIEESDVGFWGVSALCFVFSVTVCAYFFRRLRVVQRVSMWGSTGGDKMKGQGRGGWRAVDDPQAYLSGDKRVARGPVDRSPRMRELKERLAMGNGLGSEGVEALPPVLAKR